MTRWRFPSIRPTPLEMLLVRLRADKVGSSHARLALRAPTRSRLPAQTGTQQRSAPHFQEVVDILRSGELGFLLTSATSLTARAGSCDGMPNGKSLAATAMRTSCWAATSANPGILCRSRSTTPGTDNFDPANTVTPRKPRIGSRLSRSGPALATSAGTSFRSGSSADRRRCTTSSLAP